MKEEDKKEVGAIPCIIDRNLEKMSNCGYRCINVEKKQINARHVTQLNPDKHGNRYHVALDHVVDLSDYSDKEILEYAARSVVIEQRGKEIKNMTAKEVLAKFTLGFVWKPDRSDRTRKADPAKKIVTGFEKADFTSKVQMTMEMFNVDKDTASKMVLATMKPED